MQRTGQGVNPFVAYHGITRPSSLRVMRARLRNGLVMAGVAGLYILVARLGLAFDAVAGFASLVWPPTGISLAVLLLLGLGAWPGILVGAVVANVLAGAPIPVAIGIGIGNATEAFIGASLLRRMPGFSVTLESVRSVMGLIVFSAILSTLVSAVIGVASLYLGHVIAATQVRDTWRAWWVGDMLGALVVAPVILVWGNVPLARFPRRHIERVALGAAVIVAGGLAFFNGARGLHSFATPFHDFDLLLAVLIWAAMRFGPRGSATASFALATMAVAGTVLRYGPFVQDKLHLSLLSLQTFMALVASIFLVLSATVAEWRLAHQRALAEHEEAVQANLAKSEFLAVMSHELRTPLNAIAGYSSLMKEGVYGALNEKQIDAVKRVQQNEQRLLSLIDAVLGFVSAEKGEVTVQCENVRVADAFDAVEPLVAPEITQKHCVLARDRVGPALAVLADPKSLQQILVNFLSNATKYANEGGTITIGAEPVGKGDRVRIWVRDTGIGIPKGELERVFEPFFQAERGTTRRFPGVGLGLTIARDLAKRMNGDVTIASELGTGTTASVLLPAA